MKSFLLVLFILCSAMTVLSGNGIIYYKKGKPQKCEITRIENNKVYYIPGISFYEESSSLEKIDSILYKGNILKKENGFSEVELINSNTNQDGYTASNGITYRIGDTIRFGYGSGANKDFIFVTAAGWVAVGAGTYGQNTTASFANKWAIIKKIRDVKKSLRDDGKLAFLANLAGTGVMQVDVFIEDAIQFCEVVPCREMEENKVIIQNNFSVADEIKKFKELLDAGVITQEEFDIQKSKLLNK